MKRSIVIALATAGLLGTGLVPHAEAAPEPVVHDVQVGAVAPGGAPYSYTRFYPSRIEAHRGDTVRFTVPTGPDTADTQFHTVTFSPDDVEAQPGWFRPDEAPGTFAFNEAVAVGTGCGRGDAAPCVLRDRDQFFSAGSPADGANAPLGTPMPPFNVLVDAPTGDYSFRCLIHDGMTGIVSVVDEATPLDNPTPEEVAAEVEADTAAADALYAKKSVQQPPSVENGQRVWTVDAGARTADRHVEIVAYLPGTLHIAAGDAVRYIAKEPHTVTFPVAAVGPTLGPTPVPFGTGGGAFLPACDADGRTAGAPGILLVPVATMCPAGSGFELLMPLWMTAGQRAPNDAVATPATFHNSGLILPTTAPDFQRGLPKGSGNYFPSEFGAVFPAAGTFPYGCSLHAAMRMQGGVVVR